MKEKCSAKSLNIEKFLTVGYRQERLGSALDIGFVEIEQREKAKTLFPQKKQVPLQGDLLVLPHSFLCNKQLEVELQAERDTIEGHIFREPFKVCRCEIIHIERLVDTPPIVDLVS